MRVVAKLFVKKENQEVFFEIAKKLITATLAEEGNISYDLTINTKDDTCLTFIENWEDKAALELHENSDHFKEYLPKLVELCYQKPIIESFIEI